MSCRHSPLVPQMAAARANREARSAAFRDVSDMMNLFRFVPCLTGRKVGGTIDYINDIL
jgi:hypothetical protein